MKKHSLIHIVFPIIIGGFIYLLFRPNFLYLFMGLGEYLNPVRGFLENEGIVESLPVWMIYSLPNGLWVYAFTYLMREIWQNQKAIWLFIPILLGIGWESGQSLGMISGTHDIIDIIACLIGGIVAFPPSENWQVITVKRGKQFASIIGIAFFLFLAVATNGPADAVQDLYIETEEDPIEQEKMRQREALYHEKGRESPTEAELQEIEESVEEMVKSGKLDTTRNQ